jgi:hypothetical protein
MNALPPPEILAHLTGPSSHCVISYQYTDVEAGDPTRARCGAREYVIARDYHGDSVRRVSSCAIMLMVEGVRFPRLFAVNNCSGPLEVRNIGEGWTRGLLASARGASSRLDRVLYSPVAHRPTCYRVSILFTPLGKTTNTRLDERTAIRCDRRA